MKKIITTAFAFLLGVSCISATACMGNSTETFSQNSEYEWGNSYENAESDSSNQEPVSQPLYKRVDKYGYESVTGEYILFGNYPQSEVQEESLKNALTEQAGKLPTATDSRAWTSYKYYIEGTNNADFMWYQDVEYIGKSYRGVYFTAYRPSDTKQTSEQGNSEQDDNGYATLDVYWFAYEPLFWRILDKKLENEKMYATVVCEKIVDSREYHYTSTEETIDGKTKYPNNYEYSSIRKWLNADFYQTAFNDLEKKLLQTTTVDNGLESTGEEENNYICQDTVDNVWLLSAKQKYTYFPFSGQGDGQKSSTAYAHCQGVYKSTWTSYRNNGEWWLRSPSPYVYTGADPFCANHVSHGGNTRYTKITDTSKGVCPAITMWLA